MRLCGFEGVGVEVLSWECATRDRIRGRCSDCSVFLELFGRCRFYFLPTALNWCRVCRKCGELRFVKVFVLGCVLAFRLVF